MSSFIKKKRKIQSQPSQNDKSLRKKPKDAEITSSESEYNTESDHDESEDETETAQEKRLRLAKIYLQEIKQAEQERLENDLDDIAISTRLKEDYLKQSGRFKRSVADEYLKYDNENARLLQCKEHRMTVTCLCISSDDKYIFSGSKNCRVVKWSLRDRRKLQSLPFVKKNLIKIKGPLEGHSFSITSIAISDDFKYLAIGDLSNEIQIWNPDTLAHIHTLKGHQKSVTGLVFRKNSSQLYSCSMDKSVKVWALDEMSYLETLYGHQYGIMAIDALSRERAVTAGGLDYTIRLWKISEESQLVFNGNSFGETECVKLLDDEHFITGDNCGDLSIWSSMKKKPLCTVKNAHGLQPINKQPVYVNAIACLINTDLIASASNDGFIRLWKVHDSFRSISPLFNILIIGFITSLSFTSDGKHLVASVGQEPLSGRWEVIKHAKNGVFIIPLIKHISKQC